MMISPPLSPLFLLRRRFFIVISTFYSTLHRPNMLVPSRRPQINSIVIIYLISTSLLRIHVNRPVLLRPTSDLNPTVVRLQLNLRFPMSNLSLFAAGTSQLRRLLRRNLFDQTRSLLLILQSFFSQLCASLRRRPGKS